MGSICAVPFQCRFEDLYSSLPMRLWVVHTPRYIFIRIEISSLDAARSYAWCVFLRKAPGRFQALAKARPAILRCQKASHLETFLEIPSASFCGHGERTNTDGGLCTQDAAYAAEFLKLPKVAILTTAGPGSMAFTMPLGDLPLP